MAYVRTKKIKGNTYYYLVKSVRDGSKVRQVNLAYLGAVQPTESEVKTIKKKYSHLPEPADPE